MKVMFNRTKTDSFQVGTFNEGKGELIINCPVWQFAKSNQLKLTVVEDKVGEEEVVIIPSSKLVPTSEGSTVPQQTEVPTNAPQPNTPPVQKIVNVLDPVLTPPTTQQVQEIVNIIQTPVFTEANPPVQKIQQTHVLQPAPVQQVTPPVQVPPVPPAPQVTPAFNPAAEGLNEIPPVVSNTAVSVDKVNIRQALTDRSITEDEFITALSMQGYGSFGKIDNVPDETCRGCVENINAVEAAIIKFRETNK
jgi:hypothetical protein